jgi:alkylation response protein AidB-like acyl-CoA dehydrogenase
VNDTMSKESRMNFLRQERETLERLLPGLDAALAGIPLMEMERPGNPSIPVYRRLGGPGLLIPKRLGGRGASALEAVRAQRAIACRAPSLAVATTMHHFTIATVMEVNLEAAGQEAEFLESVARDKLYVASGFAESQPGTSIQKSGLRMQRTPAGIVLSGSKKPCSLSQSMDLFTASTPPLPGMDAGLAAVIIPADTPGIDRRPYWQSPILAGAESDEVILRDLCIPEDAFFPLGGSGRINPVQDRGFLWFELLITACYLGMASALCERVWLSARGGAAERVSLAAELEGAMSALEGIARATHPGEGGNDELARMLLVRYSVKAAIDRAAALAVELLGPAAFMQSPEVSYLHAATALLALHPPGRLGACNRLDAYLAGSPLVLD